MGEGTSKGLDGLAGGLEKDGHTGQPQNGGHSLVEANPGDGDVPSLGACGLSREVENFVRMADKARSQLWDHSLGSGTMPKAPSAVAFFTSWIEGSVLEMGNEEVGEERRKLLSQQLIKIERVLRFYEEGVSTRAHLLSHTLPSLRYHRSWLLNVGSQLFISKS